MLVKINLCRRTQGVECCIAEKKKSVILIRKLFLKLSFIFKLQVLGNNAELQM